MALLPLVTICGTTGVGKSTLAIELALALSRGIRGSSWQGARIINADSMQVYSGMDVITNKVPENERHGIEHLLMGFKEPGEQYVVGEWVEDAIQLIDETHRRNQIPIVVGGTTYWIQHLMFPNRLASSMYTAPERSTSLPRMSKDLVESITALPLRFRALFDALPEHPPSAASDAAEAFALHNLLSSLDPIVAARWHWRDTRKVLRCLHIIKDSGRRASEMIGQQSEIAMRPRYRTLCLWLYAERAVLCSRLDTRVDEMIKQGLLDEVRSLKAKATVSPPVSCTFSGEVADKATQADYTLGIYQAIGYREFHNYLTASEPSGQEFTFAVEAMKQSTRQYAKRQISWIRNKLLPAVYASNTNCTDDVLPCPTFLLDATELGDKWCSNVRNRATQIVEGFLEQRILLDPLTLSEAARIMLTIPETPTSPSAILSGRRKITCPICTVNKDQPVMIDADQQWEAHQRTRLHRRLIRKASGGAHEQQTNPRHWDGAEDTRHSVNIIDPNVILHTI